MCKASDSLNLYLRRDSIIAVRIQPSDSAAPPSCFDVPSNEWTARWRARATEWLGTPDSVRSDTTVFGITAYWNRRRWSASVVVICSHNYVENRNVVGVTLYVAVPGVR